MPHDPEADAPFIHPPNLKDDTPDNGLICFLDQTRECSAACMAYTTMPVASQYLNGQQRHCVLIVGVERLGLHTGVMAKLYSDDLEKKRKLEADKRRAQEKPPVTGDPFKAPGG